MAKPYSLLDEHGKPRFPRRLSTLIRIAFDDMELLLNDGGVIYMCSWAESAYEKTDGTVTCSACMAGSVLLGSYKFEVGDILTAFGVARRVADSLNSIRKGYLFNALAGYYPKREDYFYSLRAPQSTDALCTLARNWMLVCAPTLITTKKELAVYKKEVLPLVKRLAKLGY